MPPKKMPTRTSGRKNAAKVAPAQKAVSAKKTALQKNAATKKPAASAVKTVKQSPLKKSTPTKKAPAKKASSPKSAPTPQTKRMSTAGSATTPKAKSPLPLKRSTTLADKVKGGTSTLRPVPRTKTPPAKPKAVSPRATKARPQPQTAEAVASPVPARKSMSRSEAAAIAAVAVRGGVVKKPTSSPATKSKPTLPPKRVRSPSTIARKPKKLAHGRVWGQTDLRAPKTKFSAVLGDRRQKRVPWMEEECDALRKGVEQHGTSWIKILASSRVFDDSRTQVDLKDKWRLLKKQDQAPKARGNASSMPAQTHFRSKPTGVRSKVRQRWTLEEQELLLKGVKKFGQGKWTTMLTELNGFHQSRTSVDLKDKWRNLSQQVAEKE